MNVIRLSNNDLSEMIKRAVNSLLSESVREEMGSIAAGKEDVIREIVDYVKQTWKNIKEKGLKPFDVDSFTVNDEPGKGGKIESYVVLIPDKLTERLGLAEKFDLNIGIQDYSVEDDLLKYFGHPERAAEGTSYAGQGFDIFKKSKLTVTHGRIDITVPAINGALQARELHSTLYHELNHNYSQLAVKLKNMNGKPEKEIGKINLSTQTKRAAENPHFTVQRELHPDPLRGFLQGMMYGKYVDEFKAANFIIYGLWERTERNARAESIYGDLSEMQTTRETFANDYKKTDVCFQIEQFKNLLEKVKNTPVNQEMWAYVARVINMKPTGKNKKDVSRFKNQFQQEVKERFISRTEQLIDILYRKAMKVAELYFQRHEPKREPTRLERYKQEHNK